METSQILGALSALAHRARHDSVVNIAVEQTAPFCDGRPELRRSISVRNERSVA